MNAEPSLKTSDTPAQGWNRHFTGAGDQRCKKGWHSEKVLEAAEGKPCKGGLGTVSLTRQDPQVAFLVTMKLSC